MEAIQQLSHVCFAGVEVPARRRLRPRPEAAFPKLSLTLRRADLRLGRREFASFRKAPAAAEPMEPFLAWLLRRAGLEPGAYRAHALSRRLPACLRALRVSSTEAARALIERQPELLARAVDSVLIGVSAFFRDPLVFERLRRTVLPVLLQGRVGLRVCSIGCSDGRELYSVAMLLEELGALEGSCLLGVDCRPEAIARARAGVFEAADLEGITPELRARCFQSHGACLGLREDLKRKLSWEVGNVLAGPVATGCWDLLLFRNVAIYLQAQQNELLWSRFAGQLSPGGVLVTGKAERLPARLPLHRLFPCIYQKPRSDV